MENQINTILTLKNDKKYLVMNQAIYKDKNYFLVVAVNDEESDILEEFKILEEFQEDGKTYVRTVKDEATIQLLEKYLNPAI